MSNVEKVLKIRLRSSDSIADLLDFLNKTKSKKILFICPKNYPALAEVSVIKNVQSTAKELEKEVIFITLQKWLRDIIQFQGTEVYAKCPTEYLDLEPQTLGDLSEKVLAQKNESIAMDLDLTSRPISKSSDNSKPSFSTQKIQKAEHKPIRGIFFFIFLILILGLGAVLYWISPRAEITLKPKISIIPTIQNVIIALDNAQIPETEKSLPVVNGIFVKQEVSGTETFPSTEMTHDITNAHGRVTLFNETSKPKFFIPSRLSTDDGIIFRFQKEITVPPKQDDKPGSLQIEIIADEYDEKGNPIGEHGNVKAETEFFFPALRTETRELYYAKANLGPMVGGSTLTHYFINREDFESAKNILTEIFKTRAIENLEIKLANQSKREGKNTFF